MSALKITDEATIRNILTLAQKYEKSADEITVDAVNEKLQRLERERQELIVHWLEVGRQNRLRNPDAPGSADIDELLYDERGLPK